MVDHYLRHDCRLCGSTALERVLELSPTPPANAFRRLDQLSSPQARYPLDLYFCNSCTHVQLSDVVDPKLLFENYVYVSKTSPEYVDHLQDYAHDVMRRYINRPDAMVLEIGSNDGTFLRFFQQAGCKVLGVDPARSIAAAANAHGVPTRVDFFGSECAAQLANEGLQPDVILANHVYAHINDLRGVTKGIAALLPAGGFFIFEVSYLQDVIEHCLFDTIYHEHVAYHSVRAMRSFLDHYGLELLEVQRNEHQGGSLRGFAQKRGAASMRPVDSSVAAFLDNEDKWGLAKVETYRAYAKRIEALKQSFVGELKARKRAGQKIAGFGAPAKATTLMYQFAIDKSIIDFIADDNELKQGLYAPGLDIPVLPTSEIYERRPDAVVILAWNFAESMMRMQSRYLDEGGAFIIPLPEFRVVQIQVAVA